MVISRTRSEGLILWDHSLVHRADIGTHNGNATNGTMTSRNMESTFSAAKPRPSRRKSTA